MTSGLSTQFDFGVNQRSVYQTMGVSPGFREVKNRG